MRRQSITLGASIMMAAALLSRILGWVRDHAIGHYWGNTSHTDAYWAAFMVPDLLYYLLAGGALSAAVIPVFTGLIQEGKESESWRVFNTLVTALLLLAAAGVVLIVVFAPYLVLVAAPGFITRDPALAAECAGYVRIIAPMVMFTVMSALFTGTLQSHRHFTAPALSWLMYNFGIIGGAFAGGLLVNRRPGDPAGLVALCGGVIAGAILLVAVQVPSARRRGMRYRPTLDLRHPSVRLIGRLFLPLMVGLAFTQICLLWLPNFFGSFFPHGITSLRYANRLVVLPLGLFAVAISTAAFPVMAERAARGEVAEFRRLVSGSLRAILLLAIPSAAGLAVLAGPVLRLLWRSGEFGEEAVAASTFCLVFYAISLIGLSGLQITNRGFYSFKDVYTPAIVGVAYTALTVLLALALASRLEYAAVAAATSLATLLGFLVTVELLRRRLGGIEGRRIAIATARYVFASVALAAAAFYVSRWAGGLLKVPVTTFTLIAPAVDVPGHAARHAAAPLGRVALQVLLSIGAGGLAYIGVLKALRAPELDLVRDRITARLRPAPNSTTPQSGYDAG
jgi:putative peptidoglycan lipid II flippase